MSFLNLMQNKLKPKEVNEALLNGTGSSGYEIKEEETDTGITYMSKKVYCSKFNFGRVVFSGNTVLFPAPTNIELVDSLLDTFDGNTHFVSHPPTWIISGNVLVKAGYESTAINGSMVLYYTKKVTTKKKVAKKETVTV